MNELLEKLKFQIKVENVPQSSEDVFKQLLPFWATIWKWYKKKCAFTGDSLITLYSDAVKFPIYRYDIFISDKWKASEMDYNPWMLFMSQFKQLQQKTPRPHQLWDGNENCFYCDDIRQSKDCYLCVSMAESESIYYSYRNIYCKSCSDIVFCRSCENCYDLVYSHNCYNVHYGFNVWDSRDSIFLYNCRNCTNCFMCWNLDNKEYCIMNQDYSRQEYEEKIKQYNLWSRNQIKKLYAEFENHIKNNDYKTNDYNIQCENIQWKFLT